MIVFVSPVRRPNDQLEMTLSRRQSHNDLVTKVVLRQEVDGDDRQTAGQRITYLQNGVLIAFDGDDVEKTLLVCVRVMNELKNQAAENQAAGVIGDRLESRIGLAAGDITAEHHDPMAPIDRSGPPIEIAVRLVLDIAKPGQIVLAEGTVDAGEVQRLGREASLDLGLHPVPGAKLKIDGVKDEISIVELTWNGKPQDVQNWRQLARELTRLQLSALQLQFKIKDGSRPLSETVERHTIDKFRDKVAEYDPEYPGLEAEGLEEQWRCSGEAGKLSELVAMKSEMDDAAKAMYKTWKEQEPVLFSAGGTAAEAAARKCVERYEQYEWAIRRFSITVKRVFDQIQEML